MNTQSELDLGLLESVEETPVENPNENWMQHPRFTNYEVSDLGNVRDIYTHKLCPLIKKNKYIENTYIKVNIFNKSLNNNFGFKAVHKLVAEAWMGEEYDRNKQIHHISGKCYDNRLCNLKQMSRAEHWQEHSTEFGQFTNEGILVAKMRGGLEIKELGFNYSCISMVSNGKGKTHKKHIFRILKNFPSILDWKVGEKYEFILDNIKES